MNRYYAPRIRRLFHFVFLLLPLLAVTTTNAQEIFAEDFNYTCCGNINGQGGWTAFSSAGVNPINITPTGLSYPGYTGAGTGQAIQIANISGEDVSHTALASVGSGSIYAGFLINVSSASAGNLLFNFLGDQSTANSAGFQVANAGSQVRFGIIASGNTLTSTQYNTNQTYLIVLEYVGSTRTYSLYVNPALNTTKPAADVSKVHSGTGSTIINSVAIYQSISSAAAMIDGIIVSQSWSDIVGAPAAGSTLSEDFSYPCCGSINGQGSWTAFSSAGTSPIAITTGLSYPGFTGSGVGQAIQIQNTAGEDDSKAINISVGTGSVYVGFMFNATSAATSPTGLVLNFLGDQANANNAGFIFRSSGGLRFGVVSSGATTYAPSAYSFGQTYFIVLEYNNPARTYSIYVNPTMNGSKPSSSDANRNHAGSGTSTVSSVAVYQSAVGVATIDGIRVSQTWSDIVGVSVGGAGFPISESFNFTGNLNNNGWTNLQGSSNDAVPTGLTYTGVTSSGGSVQVSNGATSIDARSFSNSLSSGSVYFRFLVNLANGSGSGSSSADLSFLAAGTSSNFYQRQGFAIRNSQVGIKPDNTNNMIIGGAISTGVVQMYVLEYNIDANTYSLYQNPTLGSTVPNGQILTGISASTVDNGTIDGIVISQDNNNAFFDEFVVSNTWADVVQLAEPANQPTNFNLTSVGSTNINFNFTGSTSNPSGYIVFRGTGAPVTSVPVDNTAYAVGQTVGDAVIAAMGSPSTVTDNTVVAGTMYFYSVYAYNSSGSNINFNLNAPLQGIAATEPCCQPTLLTFSNVTVNQMDLSFTPATSPLDGYLVVRNQGSYTPTTPTDRTMYNLGDAIGSGKVAYIGSATIFTDAGLSSNSDYYYSIYSYAGFGTGINYNTSLPPLQGHKLTLATSPSTPASNIAFTGVNPTSLNFNWTVGTGTFNLVVASLSPIVSAPQPGTTYTANSAFGLGATIAPGVFTVFDGSGTSTSVSGLAPGTLYYFKVFTYNAFAIGSGNQNYLPAIGTNNPNSQTTIAPSPITQATSAALAVVSPTSLTLTWTNGDGANRIVIGRQGALPSSTPSNMVSYGANSQFGLGTALGGGFVVYNNNGNNVTVTGLTPATSYSFIIYEYNGTVGIQNYLLTGSTNQATKSTYASSPTVQSSNIIISGITSSQQTITFTAGDGTNHLVLAKAGSTVNGTPVNATGYTANAAFGSGSVINSTNYVVYNGTGNSVTVTNLTASTVYYYQVLDFNGAAATANYLTSAATGNPANQTTLAAPATVQSSGITFSSISNTAMTLTWSSGNGTNRLVLAKAGATVSATPINATAYTANASFGTSTAIGSGNYPVYNGSGNTVTVTNLTPATVYYFQIFDYTGATTTINYLTTGATNNPNNQSTYASPATTQASNVAFSGVTNTSMTVSWTNGNGSTRLVLAKSGSISSTPVNGTGYTANAAFASGTQIGSGNYVVYDGTGSTVTVTGLTASTSYSFEVFEYTGSGANANYLTSGSINNPNSKSTVAAPPTTQATALLFSAVTNTQLQLSWTPGNGATRIVVAHAGSAVDSNPVNGATYSANSVFGSGTQIGTGNYVVYSGASPSTVTVTGLTPSATYFFQAFEFNGSGVTTSYLTTTASGNPASKTILASPVATQASSITFPIVANSQVTLSWTNGTGSKHLVLARAGGAVSATPVNATGYSANANLGSGTQLGSGNFVVFDGTANSASVTGLAPNSTYFFQVFDYNGSGADNNFNTSTATSNPLSVFTTPDPPLPSGATAITQSSFIANWSGVVGATNGYFIDVSQDNFNSTVSGYGNLAVGVTTQSVTGLGAGVTYQYRIRAANATGSSPSSSSVSLITIPSTPTTVAGSSVTTTSFTATWTASAGTANYFVDVASDNGFSNFLPGLNNTSTTSTGVSVTGLTPGTNYYYRVRASNASGTTPSSNTYNQITVPLTPNNVKSTSPTSTGFIIQWDPVAGASGYELDVMNESLSFITGYQAKSVATAFSQVTGLQPSTLYVVQVRAVNAGGKSASSNQQPVQTADASGNGGGDFGPPQISLSTTSTTAAVKATIAANTGVTNTIIYYHRKITSKTFTAASPVTANSLEVTYDVANDLDDVGMEYYFKAKDKFNRQDSTAHAFVYKPVSNSDLKTQASFGTGGKLESYRIFAIPLKLSSDNIDEIFNPVVIQYGGYDKTKWRLVHYQNGQNVDYKAGLQKIEQGKGYWFNSVDAITISITGTAVEANQSNGGYALSLDAGYTQIGNPYNFDINWNDVLTSNGSPAGVGSLYVYDASKVSFRQTDVLPAWQGGFVKSDKAITLKIPVTVKRTSGRVRTAEIETADLGAPAWLLPLHLKQGAAYNEMGGIGMHPQASPENDRFDDQSLPRFVKYLELNSYHEKYFLHRFTRDVVPTTESFNWSFDVESNFEETEATLVWDAKSLGSNDAQLLLYDEATNVIVDMKRNSEYTFELAEKRSLKFMYSSDPSKLTPAVTGLGRPYPNPFSSNVTLPFITGTEGADVEILLFDATGKVVRTLVQGTFAPGFHEVSWDGTDYAGAKAAPGMYIYTLRSSAGAAQQGKIVLK